MVTGARNLISQSPSLTGVQSPEPKLYGPFRLIDSVSRLIGILRKLDLESHRLDTIQTQIDEHKYSVMESEEEFTVFMENLVMSLVPLMDNRKGKTSTS
jgi:hypothetical protein